MEANAPTTLDLNHFAVSMLIYCPFMGSHIEEQKTTSRGIDDEMQTPNCSEAIDLSLF
jgi:hypothetical protein